MGREFLGLSLRTWISLGVLLSALLAVLGYAIELRFGGGVWITRLGMILGAIGILIGSLPASGDSTKREAR